MTRISSSPTSTSSRSGRSSTSTRSPPRRSPASRTCSRRAPRTRAVRRPATGSSRGRSPTCSGRSRRAFRRSGASPRSSGPSPAASAAARRRGPRSSAFQRGARGLSGGLEQGHDRERQPRDPRPRAAARCLGSVGAVRRDPARDLSGPDAGYETTLPGNLDYRGSARTGRRARSRSRTVSRFGSSRREQPLVGRLMGAHSVAHVGSVVATGAVDGRSPRPTCNGYVDWYIP